MSQRKIDWKSGVVSTAGAALGVVCDSEVIPAGSTVVLEIWLQGRETTTGAIASVYFSHRAKYPAAGALALVGTPTEIVGMAVGSDVSIATAAPDVVISGGKLRLQVTGVGATNIEWFGDMRIRMN